MKNSVATTFLTLLLGFCFLAAYPNTEVSENAAVQVEHVKNNTTPASVKATSYIHVNDYSERIATHNQNTFTPQFLKHFSDADIKLNISKYQTLLKRNTYNQHLKTLFLNFLSTDIIFPFHTFW